MTGWDAEHRHPPALPDARHDPRDADDFTTSLWWATDASLRADPERWPTTRTDDLPPRSGEGTGAQQTTAARERWERAAAQRNDARIQRDRRVLDLLRTGPLSMAELHDRLHDRRPGEPGVVSVVYRLRLAGLVESVGHAKHARWRLCEPTPTPAPTPPPSANAGTTK